MGLVSKVRKYLDDRLFNEAFRRARVHGKMLHNLDSNSAVRRTIVAFRRERTVPEEHYLYRPELGRFVGGITGRSGTTWLKKLMGETIGSSHAVIGEQGVFVL